MKAIACTSIILAMLAGCGGNDSEPFAGCWRGTSTVQMKSGEPVPAWIDNSVLAYPIAEVCIGTGNATSVGFLCGAGHGPQAMVISPSSLSVSSYSCPSGGVSPDVGVAIEGGHGDLSRGVLTLTVDYVLTYGGQDYQVTFLLDATRICTPSACGSLTG